MVDLFCKEGGTSAGYEQAGFDVWAVDIDEQPRFPRPERFVRADVFSDEVWALLMRPEVVFVAASPPCQFYTKGQHLARGRGVYKNHADLVAKTRELLRRTGKPYVIENVPGAPLENPVQICGSYFGLRVTKERIFESNMPIVGAPCQHKGSVKRRNLLDDSDGYYWRCYGHERNVAVWREAQGTPWMSREGAANAIPPVFTEYIGLQVQAWLDAKEAR